MSRNPPDFNQIDFFREFLVDLYTESGFGYVAPALNQANGRQLEAFHKLGESMGFPIKTRQRYLDPIQKAKVDSLVRLFAEENARVQQKKALGAKKHQKRFA